MREPFRVAVWGPGNVGMSAIRECSRLPELELVAVYAFSESKVGKDAGELAGIDAMGVKVTNRFEDVLAANPDVVLHSARDFGNFAADDDIIALLEGGVNVITALPYFYPATRGDEVSQRFNDAARKGGVTLYGTGVNPSFIFQRLIPALTGLTNDVQHVSLQEIVDISLLGSEAAALMNALGLGLDMEDVDPNGAAGMVAENYFKQDVQYLADAFGKKIDRIERKDFNAPAPQDIDVPGVMTIKKGKVGMVSSRWEVICDGKPFASTQVYWSYTEVMKPQIIDNGPRMYWLIEVDGRPSTRVVMEMEGSFRPEVDHGAHDGFVSTAVTMIQAIPQVIKADPGIMITPLPFVSWKPDLRQ